MISARHSSNLDFLRAMAVLCVVAFHLLLQHQTFSFGALNLHDLGHWGVLMFFVHTSLVLMFSLERMPQSWSGRSRYGDFIVRRTFRLWPLSAAAVLLIFAMHLPLEFANGHFRPALFNAPTLVSNLLLIQDITHTDSIEAPLWSLPYEVQMYLCLPLLFWVVTRSRAIWPATMLFALAVACAVAISLSVRIPKALPWIPWDLLQYTPCFVAGVFAFALWRRELPRLPGSLWPAVVLALTLCYLMGFGGDRWISPGWTLCLALGVGTALFEPLSTGWLVRLCEVIARYSYGIYLTHFFCIWFAFSHLHTASTVMRWATFAALAVTLPLAFYHAIEEPMIRVGARLSARIFGRPREPAEPQLLPVG